MSYIKYLFLAAIIFSINCANYSYNHFKVTDTTYIPSDYVTDDTSAVTQTLVFMGYTIEKADWKVVKTKPEVFYFNWGLQSEVELQSWIIVNLESGKIKSYCTQRSMWSYNRKMERVYNDNWRFTKCRNPHVLKRIETTVNQLEQKLELGV